MCSLELNKQSDIPVKLGKLEILQQTNMQALADLSSGVNRLAEKLDKSDDIAREADQRAKSAHYRVDETNKRMHDIEADIKWLWRTVCTSIITAAIGGGAAIIWKLIG